ncbi:MAG: alpha/beta hydrolase [Halieaceae bacterium]
MLVVVALLVAVNLFLLRGDDLRVHDQPRPLAMGGERKPSEGHFEAISSLGEMIGAFESVSRKEQLGLMREYMDAMGSDVGFEGRVMPVDNGGVKGEWIVAAGGDPSRRMLYIHGGAWVMGSPLSHRAITTHYAELLGGAVFSLDYRLMPENSRQDGIDDCRAAYRWLLENGPEGASSAEEIFISGDSAGGNLTLSLINWIRDQGLRAPNAAVALSPATDGTFTSPSMKDNIATDHMLGPMFGKMSRVPKWLLRFVALFNNRISPSNPIVSPVFADLSGLPPTLVHVSAHEMLLDDAVRYVNKARAQGSPVELQAWNDMLHVWHIFISSELPEAQEAFAEIDSFLRKHSTVAADPSSNDEAAA